MDVAHLCQGQHDIREAKCPRQEGKLEEPGHSAEQEYDPHREIHEPFYNLHIHTTLPRDAVLSGKVKDIAKGEASSL